MNSFDFFWRYLNASVISSLVLDVSRNMKMKDLVKWTMINAELTSLMNYTITTPVYLS